VTAVPPEDLPLLDRTILVTRPASAGEDLAEALRRRGARPILAPAIRIVPAPQGPLDRAADELITGRYDWLLLTSRAGVEALWHRLEAKASGSRRLRAAVAAVGDGTAEALRERGIEPQLVPSTFTTFALAEAMPRGSGRVLLARADIAPIDLEAALAAKGWECVRVDAYRTVPADGLPAEAEHALRDGAVDAVTFTSASTVRGFLQVARPIIQSRPQGIRPSLVACIGPVTAAAAREAGLSVDAEAHPHTIEGLVAALERVWGTSGREERT
jgi:uroporphyrinogen-III synthase